MSNNHVPFRLSIRHLYFSIQQVQPKTKYEGIWYNIGWIKKLFERKWHPKTFIWYKKLSKWNSKIKK